MRSPRTMTSLREARQVLWVRPWRLGGLLHQVLIRLRFRQPLHLFLSLQREASQNNLLLLRRPTQ